MNEAEEANQGSDTYLQQVRLKDYKSIIDAEIDFKPGLNIIIGNNGSGKTNFLNYLYDVTEVQNWNSKSELKAEFNLLHNVNEYKVKLNKSAGRLLIKELNFIPNSPQKPYINFYINNKEAKEVLIESEDFYKMIETLNMSVNIISYSIPKEQKLIEKSIEITFSHQDGRYQMTDFAYDQTDFINSIFDYVKFSAFYKANFNVNAIREIILGINNFCNNLKEALNTFTEIKDIRLNPNFVIYEDKKINKIDVNNLYFECYVNNNWIPYALLSDGSKRLFYIISETISDSQIEVVKSIANEEHIKKLLSPYKLILLEEPELGIHPHQLHKLMLFIKEQSKTKQIILTTHSPQVLNILDADELDRIIICKYDQQLGTQLNHLTERQIEKGQMYMQDEGFLSDYWVHSDLEPIN